MAKPIKISKRRKAKQGLTTVHILGIVVACIVALFAASEIRSMVIGAQLKAWPQKCAGCQASSMAAYHAKKKMFDDARAKAGEGEKVRVTSQEVIDVACNFVREGIDDLGEDFRDSFFDGQAPSDDFVAMAGSMCSHLIWNDPTKYWTNVRGKEQFTWQSQLHQELQNGRMQNGLQADQRQIQSLCVETNICSQEVVDKQRGAKADRQRAEKAWTDFVKAADDVYDDTYGKKAKQRAQQEEQQRKKKAWDAFVRGAEDAFKAKYGKK